MCQLQNLQNFDFLTDLLKRKQISVHAMWLDIYTGDLYLFSFKEKSFIKLDENSYAALKADHLETKRNHNLI